METASPFDRLSLAIVGPEKSGKSRLASTARKPVLFLDYDKRKQAVAGYKGVYALTISDPGDTNTQPSAISDTLSLMTLIESGATLKQIGEKYGQTGWPGEKPRTIVDDSIATMAKAAMGYSLYANSELRRQITVAGQTIRIPKSYDAWNAEMQLVESIVLRQMGVKDLDVIIILHEVMEEAEDSSAEKPKYTGRIGVFPARYKSVLKYFSEVWRVDRTAQVPTIQVIPDYRFRAATNLDFSKIPAAEMRPDISYLIGRTSGK